MVEISKQGLAKMYFPNKKKKQAVRKLREWINHSPELCAKLKELGYDHTQSVTPKQIEAIFNYLGEP